VTDTPQAAMTDDREPRRYPSTIGGAFYLGVLAVAAMGILVIAFGGSWRVGLRILAGALGAAGLLRLVLPDKDAGMLAVRNRGLDVAVALVVAAALTLLSIAIPNQPE
jgi:hypothetical protein